jgi:hypothetical protein
MGTPRRQRQTNAGTKRDSDRDAGAATKCNAESRTRTSPDSNPRRPIPSAVLRILLL